MPDFSEKELEELVVGKPPKTSAIFYEHATLNVEESKRLGRRVYKNMIYVKETAPGVRDFVSRPATRKDIVRFAEEWEFFQANRQGSKVSPGIEIIPRLRLEHMQELRDMGLQTIERLAGADLVPEHLEYARRSAIMLNAVLEEQYASEEESVEESPEESIAESGQQNHDSIFGREPAGSPERGAASPPERHAANRLEHDHPRPRSQKKVEYDWSLEFKL
jgi:hypothetical protein